MLQEVCADKSLFPADRERSRSRGPSRPSERQKWEKDGIDVITNFRKVKFLFQKPTQTWYQYHLTINRVKKVFKPDSDGQKQFCHWEVGRSIFDDRLTHTLSKEDQARQEKANKSSHLSRRIIKKLIASLEKKDKELGKEQGQYFVSDGTQNAYSARPLEGLSTDADTQIKDTGESALGIYGRFIALLFMNLPNPFVGLMSVYAFRASGSWRPIN